jgi:parallel beta-helix repeat protein
MKREISRRTVNTILYVLLMLGVIILAFNTGSVKASRTVYIRADGSIDPSGAPIQRNGNFYTLTGNISSDSAGIVIERDNIVLDGSEYSVQGAGSEIGIDVSDRRNVTIRNVKVSTFEYGIRLSYSSNSTISKTDLAHNRFSIYLSSSSNNSVYQNTVKNSNYSIYLYGPYSNNNIISENTMTESNINGIWLRDQSCYNLVSKNIIANSLLFGIFIRENSSSNTVFENNVTGCVNGDGIKMLSGSDENDIYGNNIRKNALGITIDGSSNNILRNNSIVDNELNFAVYGSGLSHFIQDVDVSNTLDGKPIYYIINEKDLTIDSQNYPSVGYLAVVNSTNMIVQDLSMIGSHGQGILFVNTKNSLIQNDTVTSNFYGISLQWSLNNNIIENNLMNNSNTGIHIYYSTNNTISSNYEEGSDFGVMLQNSNENIITRNMLSNANSGIHLSNSSSNKIIENTVKNNWQGIRLADNSQYNRIYHNNFENNTYQVFAPLSAANLWDDSYPSGGNYWSDYNGTDFHRGPYQDETGSDGIGDKPQMMDQNDVDDYPLMKSYGGPHDIGIAVSISKQAIPKNYNLTTTINVTIINYGMQTESFGFTSQMGATKIEQAIMLASRNSTNIIVTWNSTGYSESNYPFEANVDVVPGEIDAADNTYFGFISIAKVGDLGGDAQPQFFKCDGKVDGKDLALFLQCYKEKAPVGAMYIGDLGGGVPPQFFKCDGEVDGKDLALFLTCYNGLGPDN